MALRISRLLTAGVGPAQILVLSFSRSAVRTVAERLERHADHSIGLLEDLRHVSIRTFDSWSFRLLRRLGELPEDLLALSCDGTVNRLTGAMTGEQREELRERLGQIRHIIVDEFQDLAGVRGRLVLALLDLLAPPKDDRVGFTILGDEAQAIYGFALRSQIDQGLPGLTTTELLDALRERYGAGLTETELETNHRSVPGLANLALMVRRILRWAHSPTTKLEALRALQNAVPESDVVPRELAATLADGVSVAILTRSNGEALRVWQQVMASGCAGPTIRVALYGATPRHTVPAWVGATLGRVQGGFPPGGRRTEPSRNRHLGQPLRNARSPGQKHRRSTHGAILAAASAARKRPDQGAAEQLAAAAGR